jgi:cysteine desulfurase
MGDCKKIPMPVYLDCAASAPLDPAVLEVCVQCLREEYGNAASRSHSHGAAARRLVEQARDRIASVCGAGRGDVIFTSGATESNNLALLGLEEAGRRSGRRHLVSTAIEHRAVLEPLEQLARRGFELTLIEPCTGGWVDPDEVARAVREETLLVSVMHVNNETGVVQPLGEIADQLAAKPAYLHTDAAQSFARELTALRHPRIDLISLSAHKICGPKGIGALIARRRGRDRPPLEPLHFGGGHERGLRPGTVPVALAAAFGEAARLWSSEADARWRAGAAFRERLLKGLAPLAPVVNGDPARSLPFLLNVSIPGWDSEAIMDEWRDFVSVSSGAACSSQNYTCSHVLSAMGLPPERARGAIRFSWCHLTEQPDLAALTAALREVRIR